MSGEWEGKKRLVVFVRERESIVRGSVLTTGLGPPKYFSARLHDVRRGEDGVGRMWVDEEGLVVEGSISQWDREVSLLGAHR